jgi:hypothetical protein
MKIIRKQQRSRRGSTLLEIVVATAVMILLLGAVGNTVLTGSNTFKQGLSAAMLEGQGRRMLERIASEFADVDRSSLAPNPLVPFGSAALSYARCQGWAAGAIVVGPTRRIALVLENGELDNGIDDNSNGAVDERRVVLIPDTANPGETVGLGGWVRELAEGELPNGLDDNGDGLTDEAGLAFRHDGNGTLTISLTLERPDPWGRLVARTLRTAVRMRND